VPDDVAPAGRLRSLALVAAMAVVALNIWTGAPLLALWVGSRVQGDGPPTMGAIFIVIACMGGGVLALSRLLSVLGAAHEAATGRHQVRRHVPWLRSMRGEREHYEGDPIRLSVLDRTLVVVVVVAVVTFEIWFFFFSSSSIDQRSGRAASPAVQSASGQRANRTTAS
jgi:hypothetical protein